MNRITLTGLKERIKQDFLKTWPRFRVISFFTLPGLTDTMATILGLFVIVRVEVEIVKDHSVGRGEIDAQSSGFGRQDEDKDTIILVVLIDHDLSVDETNINV